MSLTSALNTAKTSLSAIQTQTSVASSNIANVNVQGATRKTANVVTAANGSVAVTSVSQSSNSVLFRNMLDATSSVSQYTAQYEALSRINEVVGDTNSGVSPQAKIASLQDALNDLATTPGSSEMQHAALQAAQDLVSTLNENTEIVSTIRRDADTQLVNAAADMNDLLSQFEAVNRQIVSGTAKGSDVTDMVDKRDQLVTKLSQYVGVNVQTRGNNDMVLFTDSGVTLFETTARAVSFQATNPLQDGKNGNAFYIDGIAVTGDNAYMPLKSGSVLGATNVRDEICGTYQTQLDEIARGLINAFAETDPAGVGTKATGLFTAAGLTFPLDDTVSGLARNIQVASAAATNPSAIRDGVTYSFNTGALGGYSARINDLLTNMATKTSFSPSAKDDTDATLANFAASSVSWLQQTRSSTSDTVDSKATLLTSTQTTLSDETGINLDTELTKLIDLERSYQASSKIISVVDDMMQHLLESV